MSSYQALPLVRKFSSSAVKCSAMIKPPVAVFGVEGRYATALYSAAMKEKKIDAVEKDMKALGELLEKDKKFGAFVLNPLVKTDVKIGAISKALAKKNFSSLTVNLLASMTENGRMKSLTAVINCFNEVMANIRGEVVCKIVSAKSLDAPTLAEFEKAFKGFLKKDEKVILQTQVDPSLIGGVVISIGDRYVDMSIASKIKTYNKILREVV